MTNINYLHQQAQKSLNHSDFQTAQQYLLAILKQDKAFYDAYFLLGIIEAELGQYNKAVSLIQKAISIKETAEYFAHLAKCLAMLGNSNETYGAIVNAEKFTIKRALTLDTLGVALSRLGQHHKAIEYFERAIEISKKASFYYNLGASQTFSGLFTKAADSYEQAIKLEPLFYQAHSSLSHLGGVDKNNNHVARLKDVFNKMTHPDAKLHISHALARELDTLGYYDECFNYLDTAKQQKLNKLNYNFKQDLELFDGLKRLFTDTDFLNKQWEEESTAKPIFVVGMPRSGTTLIERVLTNNTGIKSAGELQEFGLALKQLTQSPGRYILDPKTLDAAKSINFSELGKYYINSLSKVIQKEQRFVDKMPLNVLYGGLIAKALPQAKTICVIRNPMDTIWGNYKQMFSLNDPYYNYAYDQLSIAQFYHQFVELAEFWQNLYPEQFKIVSYDAFVQNPEVLAKDIMAFCDIEYTSDILDITKNTAAVATASSVQVRSPINTKSLGGWKKYKEHLQPAFNYIKGKGFYIG
jgi:tetratricopeptide (TPR) repeat protein